MLLESSQICLNEIRKTHKSKQHFLPGKSILIFIILILILIGLNLWPKSTVDEHRNVLHQPQQRIEWTESQTEEQRYEYLSLDLAGQVTVDLKMAKGVASKKFH